MRKNKNNYKCKWNYKNKLMKKSKDNKEKKKKEIGKTGKKNKDGWRKWNKKELKLKEKRINIISQAIFKLNKFRKAMLPQFQMIL